MSLRELGSVPCSPTSPLLAKRYSLQTLDPSRKESKEAFAGSSASPSDKALCNISSNQTGTSRSTRFLSE